MERVKNVLVNFERITEGPEHNFFGYYDNPAWDGSERYHLCHKVKFWDRLPEKNDVASLGMIDLENKQFIPLAETTAWNFQQGTMLQWNPKAPSEEIIFNVREGDEYRGVIKNIETGARKMLERPVANIDPTGRYGLSINFNRVYDFRAGYGYAGVRDAYYDDKYPEEDGVFLVDLESGKSKQIISYKKIWEIFNKDHDLLKNKKIVVNHITFNTDGTRFLFLVRYFPEPGGKWGTALGTSDVEGRDIYCLSEYTYASHYHWRDPESILIHARQDRGDQLYVLTDKTHKTEVADAGFFLKDGHCSYSPNREFILYDSYPDSEGYRNLYLYSLSRKEGYKLASLYSDPISTGDIRTDLHPRWNRSGTAITFDSTHEGARHIYLMKLEGFINSLK